MNDPGSNIQLTLSNDVNKEDLDDQQSLAERINRITVEHGSFASLTEEKLENEIEAGRDSEGLNNDESYPSNNGGDDGKAEGAAHLEEDLREAQESLTQLVTQARNESALALDFVSLLLTSIRPAAGSSSMSPLLRERVPLGSMLSARVRSAPRPDDALVSQGLKMEAAANVASRFQSRAKRLAEQIRLEDKYWSSIADLSASGGILCRVKEGDKRGLGLKYGFREGGSDFPNPGIASLQRSSEGTVIFDPRSEHSQKNFVVSIWRKMDNNDICTGFHISQTQQAPNVTIGKVYQARRAIFEHELFFLMVREARMLLVSRVTIKESRITAEIGDKMTLVIELADPTYINKSVDKRYVSDKDNSLAEFFSSLFHLLLSNAFRHNLERRQHIREPLSTNGLVKGSAIPSILRPVIATIRHQNLCKQVGDRLQTIISSMERCGLTIGMKVNKFVSLDGTSNKNIWRTQKQAAPINRLLAPPRSEIDISFKEGSCHIHIHINNPLQPSLPLFVARYSSSPYEGPSAKQHLFSTPGDLFQWILWVLQAGVLECTLSKLGKDKYFIRGDSLVLLPNPQDDNTDVKQQLPQTLSAEFHEDQLMLNIPGKAEYRWGNESKSLEDILRNFLESS